jgi:hypothetical protein
MSAGGTAHRSVCGGRRHKAGRRGKPRFGRSPTRSLTLLTLALTLHQGAKEIPVAPEITTFVVPEGAGLFRTVLLLIDVPVQTPTA